MKSIIKKVMMVVIVFILLMGSAPSVLTHDGGVVQAHTADFAGKGTEEDPYLIATAEQLDKVRDRDYVDSGSHFKLVADIDLDEYLSDGGAGHVKWEGEGWEPIGRFEKPFYGHMDGNGYTISNLIIDRPDEDYIGLFGFAASDSSMTHMKLVDVNVVGKQSVGGLVGRNQGKISHSYTTGNVEGNNVGGLVGVTYGGVSHSYFTGNVSGALFVGGLVGVNYNGDKISYSHATGSVSGSEGVGGLVGQNHGEIKESHARGSVSGGRVAGGLVGQNNGEISKSYATGDVEGKNDYVGGLVGWNLSGISYSYAIGDVEGKTRVGGLVGLNHGEINESYATSHVFGDSRVGGLAGSNGELDMYGTISQSYATGKVASNLEAGGLVGSNGENDHSGMVGTVSDSFYDQDTTGQDDEGKGEPKSTAEMKTQVTFTDSGWDFDDVWGINELYNDGYPYLQAFLSSVTYDGNGHTSGSVPIDNTMYIPGEEVTVLGQGGLLKEGHSFVEWNRAKSGIGEGYQENEKLILNSHTILYAKWDANHYEVSFEANGGTPMPTQTNVFGGKVSEPTPPTRAGYTFEGWYKDLDLKNAWDFAVDTVPAKDITLYAKWLRHVQHVPQTYISTSGYLSLPARMAGVVSLDGVITLSIPAGATDEHAIFTMTQVLDIADLLTEQDVLVSEIYELLVNRSEPFSKPVVLNFVLEALVLQSEQTLGIFYYDEEAGDWIEVPGSVIKDNQISVEVDHFTKFAVFNVEQETTEMPDESVSFSDIATHWGKDQIEQALKFGIVSGYPDGTFKPDATVNRAEFTVMLMNALQLSSEGTELSFRDTDQIDIWAREAVTQSVVSGIITGYDDNSFRPAAPISRAELAVMIARAYDVIEIDGNDPSIDVTAIDGTSFADDQDIPHWARSEIALLKQLGIIMGRSGNLYAPHDTATRAEAVTIIMNLLEARSREVVL